MYALKIAAVIVASYLFGNINTALIISRIKKGDVRKMGSGNPGTMNMFRNYGVMLGVFTLIGDILKGALPCLFGWWLLGEEMTFGSDRFGLFLGGLSVIVGHIFPVFMGFKGGKGIASSIGVCLVANPIVTLVTFAVGAVFLIITHLGSITSFLIISFPLAISAFAAGAETMGVVNSCLIFALFALTLFAHRGNVVKLFMGKERATVLFGKKKKTPSADA